MTRQSLWTKQTKPRVVKEILRAPRLHLSRPKLSLANAAKLPRHSPCTVKMATSAPAA